MRRNGPERALFKEEPDSYDTRINRFGQYKNTPSLVWTREVIQNSVDNGATKVQLTICRCKDRNVVTVSDNGTGMDRTTLQEKFLTMGGTGKGSRDSGESIGGFGEAKKVILLAWKAWQVVTTKNGVTTYARSENGGREYEIDSFRDGRPDGTEVSVLTWESPIYTINGLDFSGIVQKSNLDGKVQFSTFSFQSAGTATLPTQEKQTLSHDHATKIYGRLPLPGNAKFTINDSQGRPAAKIYVEKAKNAHGSSIYYRAKGLWLWDKYVSIEKEGRISKIHLRIIVEFIVKTTTILSDNRDSIKDPVLRKGIDKIIQDVVTDPRLFVRGISENAVIIYKGEKGSLAADEEAMRLSGMITRSIEAGGMIDKTIDHVVQKVAEKIEQKTDQSPIEMDEKVGMKMFEHAIKSIKFEGAPDKKAIENLVKMAIRSPDIKLFVEEDLQMEGYEIHKKFKPESFTEDVKKILSLWAEMCRIVFTVRGSHKRFGIGFIFSKEAVGLRTSGIEGCDGFLLINPYIPDISQMSKMVDISNIDHVKTMWSACIHECTHMIDDVSEHNEAYAIRLTENIASTASCWGLVKQLAVLIGSKKTEIEKSKFSKDIDLDFFFKDDLRRKSVADAKMEKYIAVVVEELSSKGGKIPQPEEFGLEVTTDLVNRIKSAASRSSDSMSSANKLVIESLKRKLEEKSKIKDPEKLAVIFKNPRGKR